VKLQNRVISLIFHLSIQVNIFFPNFINNALL